MNNRSIVYLKEAVTAVLKGHLTPEEACEKYSLEKGDIESALLRYSRTGNIEPVEKTLFSEIYARCLRLNIRSLFGRLAPTYDQEKEIDRFKFKTAYAMMSFALMAAGIAILGFSTALNPPDMRAESFEDKLNQTMLTASKRPAAIDAEIKYLNRFYSRINRILEKSDSRESQALRDEIAGRMDAINNIDKTALARKAVNFTDVSMNAGAGSAGKELYKKFYETSAENGDNYFAQNFRQRMGETAVKAATGAAPAASIASAPPAPAIEERSAASSDDAGEPVAEITAEDPENLSAMVETAVTRPAIAKAKKAAPARETAEPTIARKVAASPEKVSYKNADYLAGSSYETIKDKLFIINKYNHNRLLKKVVKKEDLKFKYPVVSLIPILDRQKYDESLKKIANNPKNEKFVKITEDRG